MESKRKPDSEKGFVQIDALILHEQKTIFFPEESNNIPPHFYRKPTTNSTRDKPKDIPDETQEPKPKLEALSEWRSFKGEFTGILSILVKQKKHLLSIRFKMQDGKIFTATTNQPYTIYSQEEQAEGEHSA